MSQTKAQLIDPVDGSITGADLATNIDLIDNQIIRFGAGNDLQIYHNGSTNIIDAATSNTISFRRGNSEQFFIGNEEFKGGDNKKIKLGTSDDLEIYHSSGNAASYIQNSTGNLFIEAPASSAVKLRKKGTTETMIVASSDGAAELYFDNSKKFETTSGGVEVTGNIIPDANNTRNIGNGTTNFNAIWASTRFRGNDNVSLQLGNSVDFKILHDGTTNLIESPTGSDLHIKMMGNTNDVADQVSAKFIEDGAVELYFNGTKKFETSADGAAVSNISNNKGLDLNGVGNNTGIRFMSTGSSPGHAYRINFHSVTNNIFNSPCISFDKTDTSGTFDSHIGAISDDGFHLADNKKLHLGGTGANGDLQIFHDGSNSRISDNGTGNLILDSNNVIIESNDNTETQAKFITNGAVELYHDNSRKFSTTARGVELGDNGNLGQSYMDSRLDVSGVNSRLVNFRGGDTAANTTGSQYRFGYSFVRATNEITTTLVTNDSANGNCNVAYFITMYVVAATDSNVAKIELFASAQKASSDGGSGFSYFAASPSLSNKRGSTIAAGSLAWSGNELQYTTNSNLNYTKYVTEVVVAAHDRANPTFP